MSAEILEFCCPVERVEMLMEESGVNIPDNLGRVFNNLNIISVTSDKLTTYFFCVSGDDANDFMKSLGGKFS